MNLQQLAEIVRSDYRSLQPSEIVGRIILITGRSFSQAQKGYEMMKAEGLFDGFIDIYTIDMFAEMLERNPNLIEAADRLGLIPPMATKKYPKPVYRPPIRSNRDKMINDLNLPEF